MFLRGKITYLYFLIIDNEISLISTSDTPAPDPEAIYLAELEQNHSLSANWEAAAVQTIIVNREDLLEVQVAVPFEPLYSVKKRLTKRTKDYSQEMYGDQTWFNEFELYAWKHPELVSFMTFSRDEEANWYQHRNPIERSVNARSAPLGIPGGPCHVIRNIEEAALPDRVKKELVEDIERGKDLSKSDENLLYDTKVIPSRLDLFQNLKMTSHIQFRMDQRGVSIYEVEAALGEFSRWYLHRKNNPHSMKPKDQKTFQDLAYGDPIRFDARKAGITLVFAIDSRKKEAALVSTWWTNQPNPSRPSPGECEIMPYFDRDRDRSDRPKVLGGHMPNRLLRMAANIRKEAGKVYKTACGGDCAGDCGGDCAGDCGDSCGCKVALGGDYRGMREMLLMPTGWGEAREDDYWYDDDRKD